MYHNKTLGIDTDVMNEKWTIQNFDDESLQQYQNLTEFLAVEEDLQRERRLIPDTMVKKHYVADLPVNEITKKKQFHCKKSTTMCIKCNLPLHVACFVAFHVK